MCTNTNLKEQIETDKVSVCARVYSCTYAHKLVYFHTAMPGSTDSLVGDFQKNLRGCLGMLEISRRICLIFCVIADISSVTSTIAFSSFWIFYLLPISRSLPHDQIKKHLVRNTDTQEILSIFTNLPQNSTPGRFRSAASESQVRNLEILHPDIEMHEQPVKFEISKGFVS